jgi:hypothetical protein
LDDVYADMDENDTEKEDGVDGDGDIYVIRKKSDGINDTSDGCWLLHE